MDVAKPAIVADALKKNPVNALIADVDPAEHLLKILDIVGLILNRISYERRVTDPVF